MTNINLSEAERELIDQKLAELKEVCSVLQVPMFATVVVANDESGTKYLRSVRAAQSHATVLYRDEIRKHILISNDFEVSVVPRRDVLVLDEANDFFCEV